MNRREFLQQTGLAVGVAAGMAGGCAEEPASNSGSANRVSGTVAIVTDPADAVATSQPATWAAGYLADALGGRGLAVAKVSRVEDAPSAQAYIVVSSKQREPHVPILPDAPESLSYSTDTRGGKAVLLTHGADARGLVYALTELRDSVALVPDPIHAINNRESITEQPANRIRGIGRLFSSDIEDKPWYNDKGFWQRYLTMLASNRFNRFHLALGLGYDTSHNILDSYFYFPYPFLLAVPGYDVKAVGLPDAERDNNLAMLKFIGDECAARGIDFQLGLWGHQYVFEASPNVNYPIAGLTKETHANYCRDALALVLKACPNVTGVTFRVHGESGIAEGSYDFWKTVFDGVVRSGRKMPIEMHAKGSDQQIIDIAFATGMPVILAPKTWSEHTGLPYAQTDIRALEKPKPNRKDQGFFATSNGSRSFTRYGYADFLTEDRKYQVIHRMWPGTQRHLLWGDPLYAASFSQMSHFCGMDGHELFEPLTFKGRMGAGIAGGRQAYADASLKTADDFEKYRYYYVQWGRHLYNPDTKPEVWQRELRRDYGDAAAPLVEAALSSASRILPLVTTAHSQSASYTGYWVELSWNMSIVDAARKHPYSDTPSPKVFGKVSPLDPQIFVGIDEYVDELSKNQTTGKYNPAEVAERLEALCMSATNKLDEAHKVVDVKSAAFRRMAVDVMIVANTGMYFAKKMRAAMLWSLHDQSSDPTAAAKAIEHYKTARMAWAIAAMTATDVYAKNISYGPGYFQKGHWADRLPLMDQDIADMEKRAAGAKSDGKLSPLIDAILKPAPRPTIELVHRVVNTFKRAADVPISIRLAVAVKAAPVLHYRHVNQAENWTQTDMHPDGQDGQTYVASIPAAYTDSAYPLQYYFELRDPTGRAVLSPGFNADWSNQPYYVIRQARA